MAETLTDDNVSQLWNNIRKEYNVPDINVFRQLLADSAKRRKLHETLIKDNYDLPDFNTFSIDMGFESSIPKVEKTTPAPAQAPVSSDPAKQQAPSKPTQNPYPTTSKKGQDLGQLNDFMQKQEKAGQFSPMYGEEEVKQKKASEFADRATNNRAATIIKNDAQYQASEIKPIDRDLVTFDAYLKKKQEKALGASEELELWANSGVSQAQVKLNELVHEDPEYNALNQEILQKQTQYAGQLKQQALESVHGQTIDANQAKALNDQMNKQLAEFTDMLSKEYEPKYKAIEGKYFGQVKELYNKEYTAKAEELMRPDTRIIPQPILDYGNKLVESDVFDAMSYSEKQNALLTSWKRMSKALVKQGKKEGEIMAMRDEYMYAMMPKVLYDEKRNITSFGIRSFAEEQLEGIDKKISEAKSKLQKISAENPGSQSVAPSIAEYSQENMDVSPVILKQKEEVDRLIQSRDLLTQVLDMPDGPGDSNWEDFKDGFLDKGIRNKIPFISAMLDITDMARVKTVVEKQRALEEKQKLNLPINKEDELTPSEQLLINSQSAEVAINQAVTPSMWYNAGSATAQSLPFMGEFIATGGVFDGTYQAAKAGLAKTFGSFGTKKSVENLVIKPMAGLLAIEAQTAANPQQYIKNTLERMSPGMQLAMSEEGDQVIGVLDWNTKQQNGVYNTGKGEDFKTAFLKGFLLTSAEAGTERLGELGGSNMFKWGSQVSGLDKVVTPDLMKRLTLGYYLEKYGLSLSEAKKHFLTHSIGFNGFGNEFFVEEMSNIPLTNLITGDQAVLSGFLAPEGKEQEILDWQNLGTIAISIGATTVAFSGIQLAMARKEKGKEKDVTVTYKGPDGRSYPVKLKSETWNELLKAQSLSVEELIQFKADKLPNLKAKGTARQWIDKYVDSLIAKKQEAGNPNAAPTTNSPVDEMMAEVADIVEDQAQEILEENPELISTLNTDSNAKDETRNEEKGNVELQNGEDAKDRQENGQQKVGKEVLNPVGSEQTPATETETGVSMTPKDVEKELGDAFSNLQSADKKAIREGQDPKPILQKRIDALKERIQQNADDVDIVEMANQDIDNINNFLEKLPVENKKAEIEKRRKDALFKQSFEKVDPRFASDIPLTSLNNPNDVRDKEEGRSITGNRIQIFKVFINKLAKAFPEKYGDLAELFKGKHNESYLTINSFTKIVNTLKKEGINTTNDIVNKLQEFEKDQDAQINAKYDAELAALEKPQPAVESKADVDENDILLNNAIDNVKSKYKIKVDDFAVGKNGTIEAVGTSHPVNGITISPVSAKAYLDKLIEQYPNLDKEKTLQFIYEEAIRHETQHLEDAYESKPGQFDTKQKMAARERQLTKESNQRVADFINQQQLTPNTPTNESNTETEERSTETLITKGEAIEAEAANYKPGESSKSILQKIEEHINSLNAKIVKLTENWDESELTPDEQAGRQAGKAAKKEVRKYAGEVARLLGWNALAIHDNIAPAGGDVTFRLEIPDTPLEMWVAIKYEPNYDRGAYENYKIDQFFYRVENNQEKGQNKYVGPNQWMFFNKPQFGLKQEASIPTPKQLALIFAKEAAPYIDKYGETQKKATDAVIDILENGPNERKNAQWGYTEDTFIKEALVRLNSLSTGNLPNDITNVIDDMIGEMASIAHPNTRLFNAQRFDLANKIQSAYKLKQAKDKIQDIVNASGAPKANVIIGSVSPTPPAQQPTKSNKKPVRRIQDEELDGAIEDLLGISRKNRGKLGMNNIDTELLAQALKVVRLYLRNNVYKFADIIEELAARNIDKAKELFDDIKTAYAAYQMDSSTTEEVADLMDDTRAIKKLKFEDVINEADYQDEVEDQPTNSVDHEGFVNAVTEKLRSGDTFSNRTQFEKLAATYGVADQRVAMELVEAAVVNLVREISMNANLSEQEKYDKVVALYELQPSLSIRTSESISKQQYSTPAPYSYGGAIFVGGVGATEGAFFEPSAGNGLFVAGINPALVDVNEIDQTRSENLSKQGFANQTGQDALIPFAGRNAKYDGVLTNPPFGGLPATISIDGYKISALEHLMSIRALDTMKPDGKAAIVIGGHIEYNEKGVIKGRNKPFFNYLYSHYNVVDVISVSGDLYSRQGTSFPTTMILISGRKQTPSGYAPVKDKANTNQVNSWAEFKNRIDDAREQSKNLLQPEMGAQPGAGNVAPDTGTQSGAEDIQPITSIGGGPNTSPGSGSRGGRSGSGGNNGGISGRPNIGGNQPESVDQNPNEPTSVPTDNTDSSEPITYEEQFSTQPAGDQVDLPGSELGTDSGIAKKQDVITTSKPVVYNASSKGSSLGTPEEPINISGSIANGVYNSLYKLEQRVGNIDRWVAGKLEYPSMEEMYNALAAEQIDAVALAIDNIEKGEALIVGDMTGIGKGRIAAATIRYCLKNGKLPIFITEKTGLFADMYRDLKSIGSGENIPFIFSNSKDARMTEEDGATVAHQLPAKGLVKDISDGIQKELPSEYEYVAMTYTMVDQQKRDAFKREFLLNLVENREVVLIMDESHNASGGNTGTPKKDKQGNIIVNRGAYIRNLSGKANGVLFLSATFAKRPDNMPLYALKTSMSNANISSAALIRAIDNGGVTLQEILAKGLSESGQMIRRERSYDGVKFYYPETGKANPELGIEENSQKAIEQQQQADKVLDVVRDIMAFEKKYVLPLIGEISDDLADTQGTAAQSTQGAALGITNVEFASKLYNIINQLLLALKAEDVAKMAINELKQGRKPTIFLMNTMEGFIKDMDIEINEEFDNPDFTLVLKKGLDGTFTYIEKLANDEKIKKTVPFSRLSPEGKAEYNKIDQKIKATSSGLWLSPIDHVTTIIESAGYKVGEITGRYGKLTLLENGKMALKKRMDAQKKRVRAGFNFYEPNSKKNKYDVIIFNSSGSTGISLHSSKTFTDQRQRSMIILQPHHDINILVQALGRIFRSGQVNKPQFILPSSALPAENRINMMIQSKLKSLNANTSGDQEGETEMISTPDFINKYGDIIVSQYLNENEDLRDMLFSAKIADEELEDEGENDSVMRDAAKKTTGRVAMLPSAMQKEFYDEITIRYNNYINYLNEAGENTLKIETLPLNAELLSQQILVQGNGADNPFGADTFISKYAVDVLKQPLEKPVMQQKVNEHLAQETPQGQVDRIVEELKNDLEVRKNNLIAKKQAKFEEKQKEKLAKIAAIPTEEDRAIEQKAYEDSLANEINSNEVSIQRQVDKLTATYAGVEAVVRMFKPKRSIYYPTSISGAAPAVVIGVDINYNSKNPYAPSNMKLKVAVLDSLQSVSIPLSQTEKIQSIRDATNIYAPMVDANLFDNWDNKKATKQRSTMHVLTGNIIQGYGHQLGASGKIISFNTKDGNVAVGIKVDSSLVNNTKVKASVKNLLDVINSKGKLETENGVEISGSATTGYEIKVPLSTSSGGKYFLNEGLRALVRGGNFVSRNQKMVASVDPSNIQHVLNLLGSEYGETAEIDSQDLPDPDSSRSNTRSNLESGKIDPSGEESNDSGTEDDDDPNNPNSPAYKDPLGPKLSTNKYDQMIRAVNQFKINTKNSAFSLLPPFGFALATWNTALDVLKASISAVKTIDAAIQKAVDYLRTEHQRGSFTFPFEESAISDYLTLLATNPTALLSPNEIVKLRAKVKQGLKAKYTAFEIKYYGSPTKTDADFKKVYTNPVIAAQNLLDKPNKVAGNAIAGVTRAGLTSDWAAIRFVAKSFKSVFQNLERDQDWVLRSEKMKGAADNRAITDAMTAINEMRKLLANEPDALQRIDQVLDPEIYKKKNKENFLKDFENFHLLNYGYSPFNSFKIFSGTVIPGLTAKEQQALYDEYLNDPDSKYNNPTVVYDDLTAAEKAVHDMIRDIYDMIHDMNFVMKKVSFPTYLLNKGKYSARMYDFFEVPDEMKKEVGELNRLMQLDMYKERGALTSWKIDNNMQDPTYKLGKRLFQTMVNQAVYDYASYVAKNRRFAVSSTPKPGFVRLQGRAYGVLHNKYVMKDLAEDFRGFFFANDTMQKLFEIMKAVYYFDPKGTLNPLKLLSVQWYKRLFTVLTPATMLGNRIGNFVFAATIGIPPTEFNMYYHGFASGEMKDMGPTARYLMDRGLLNSDISMDDVRKSANNLSLISGQTAPKLSMLYLPTKNLIGKVASGKMSIDELKKYYAENPLTVAGDIMEYHYHATDDLAKIAAFKALVDSGTPPEMAANKIAESFQNRHRVGSAYKVAAMIPIFGPIFGSFAGDMVRITLKNYTRTPLTYGIFLAALSGLASMLSVGSGEDPDKRKIREGRPGFAKIPQFNFSEDPNWSYIPILNFFGPDIPLQYKVNLPEINFGDGSYSMVEKELNLARFLSPLYLYSSNDDSDAGEFIKKLSPLPIDFVEAEEARNPTGSLAVMFAKNNRDPRFAIINASIWVDSDFTGKAISDRKATENKPSRLRDGEKLQNAIAYLFRSYFPYGQMVDDLRRVNKDGKDYYLRDRTNSQIILRFFGYNAQQFPDTKYREIVENKLENKVYTFLNNEKLIFGIEKEFKGAIIEDLNKLIKANPGKYKDLTNEAVETLTYQKLKEAYTLIRENKEIRVPHQDLVKRLQEKYIKQADLLLDAQTTIIDSRRSMTKEAIDKILKDISMNQRSRAKLNAPKKPKTEN